MGIVRFATLLLGHPVYPTILFLLFSLSLSADQLALEDNGGGVPLLRQMVDADFVCTEIGRYSGLLI